VPGFLKRAFARSSARWKRAHPGASGEVELFSSVKSRLRSLLRKSKMESELDEELRYHIEQQTDQYTRMGMSREEARAAALKSFGGVEQAKERSRDARGVRWLEEFWQDLRYGARMLLKNPGFTLIAALSLALGIGANTAIFTWLKAFYLQPLPGVAASHRLVALRSTLINSGDSPMWVSYPNYKDYRDRNQVFSGLAAFNLITFNLVYGKEQPERIWGSLVSGNYFDVLGLRPALGRFFAPDEGGAGIHPVAIISYRLWQRRFGADPTLIGKTIQLNKLDFTVIGVTPEGFRGSILGGEYEIWAPSPMYPQISPSGHHLFLRGSHHFLVIGRLKEGVTIERAQANVQAIAAQLAKDYPEAIKGEGARLYKLVDEPSGAGLMAQWLWVLMAVAGMVLLIACANVANLLLARAAGRSREMGIRLALGAWRSRLIRQMLTESMLLAVIGGVGGALLAAWLSNAMSLMLPTIGLPLSFNIDWDYRVSGFALALTLLTVIAVGLVPALRSVMVDPIVSIRNDNGAASSLMKRSRLRSALVVTQIAVSLVSLVCAGLFIRNLVEQKRVNLGFDPERALLVSLELFPNGYDEKRGAEFYRHISERVSALPGVESVTLSDNVPPTVFGGTIWTLEIEGYLPRAQENMGIEYEIVASRYFKTMRIPLVEGREFSETDQAQSAPVAIVNETMARRYWPGQNALGKRLRGGGGGPWSTVIGVARDVKNIDAREPVHPWMYYPLTQSYNSKMTLVVRTAGDPLQALTGVRGVIRSLDATLPLFNVKTLENHCGVPMFIDRIVVTYLSGFGLLALGLAAIGLYGVIAYTVAARSREIAIRMALGAQTSDVLKLVIRQGVTLASIGVVIGLIIAFGLTRLIKELLFGVNATDPLTFILIALLLTLVALLAAYLPARRAAKVDPMVALRWE
jgi:putative ABC transport system permease protein